MNGIVVVSSIAISLALQIVPGSADIGAGAKLVLASGCAGCHGAALQGGVGPKLYGIEHRRTAAQIARAITSPVAPMPKVPFSDSQVQSIVVYLSSLDGGGGQPVATLDSAKSGRSAVLTVRFPGTPPKNVTVVAAMQMGSSSMTTAAVTLRPTADPHVWKGNVSFSMGGPWEITVHYDGKRLVVPVNVSGGR